MKTIAELSNLNGRAALITGGGGHLGFAIASALAEQGCSICLLDRNETSILTAKNELEARWNVGVASIALDLENESARMGCITEISACFGRLDILINNAAFVGDSQLQGWAVPFEQQSIETWRRAVEVNCTAAFHMTQLCTPLLRASGHGSIINIGSIYGVLGPDMGLYEGTSMGNPAAYAASKGGLIQLNRWLATTLAPDVRVNCITPGGIARNQAASFSKKYIEKTPLKRMGTEEDIIGIAVYLASDLSSWVTGQNFIIDGGWSAW